MPNKFSNFTEQELIAVLQSGKVASEAEFQELLAAMNEKGLRGMIMPVKDPGSWEMAEMKAYIQFHKDDSLKKMNEADIINAENILFDPNTPLEKKKWAIVSLAHIVRPDVFDVLKKYNENPEPTLRVWAQMALDECRAFLQAELGEGEKITISSLAGRVGERLRYYFVLNPTAGLWHAENELLLRTAISEVSRALNFEIENVEFGDNFVLVTALHLLDQAQEELVDGIFEFCDCDGPILGDRCLISNTHKPPESEIKEWLARQ